MHKRVAAHLVFLKSTKWPEPAFLATSSFVGILDKRTKSEHIIRYDREGTVKEERERHILAQLLEQNDRQQASSRHSGQAIRLGFSGYFKSKQNNSCSKLFFGSDSRTTLPGYQQTEPSTSCSKFDHPSKNARTAVPHRSRFRLWRIRGILGNLHQSIAQPDERTVPNGHARSQHRSQIHLQRRQSRHNPR